MIKNLIIALMLVWVGFLLHSNAKKGTQVLDLQSEVSLLRLENEGLVRRELEVRKKKLIQEIEAQDFELQQKKLELEHQEECMARNIYFEARGEPVEGQEAVADVVLNRVKSKYYPDTICEVVYQEKQFSWTIDTEKTNKPLTVKNRLYRQALDIAKNKMRKANIKIDATHYHTHGVDPIWNRNMKQVALIGGHRFFRN